tara:strand:+ start:11949 stop:12311 length:363 start_codon:yes stop_codon:yes gene_type:complete
MGLNTTRERLLDKQVKAAQASRTANEASQTANESVSATNKLSLGDNGCVMISGNAAQSVSAGTYFAVQFLKACTPTALTIGSSTTVTSTEIPAGTILYGDITAITGDSGAFYVLYKGNPA